ncbi:MAG: TrkA C-terminal domain-containing protein [Planctomycetota bacterium]
MIALGTFFFLVVLTLLVERGAIVGFMQTGMSKDAARFQARSAWTGTGFTTEEAEQITRHPGRRHIVQVLMIVRGAGFVGIIGALIAGLQDGGGLSAEWKIGLGVGGSALLLGLSFLPPVDHALTAIAQAALKNFTSMELRDYHATFGLSSGYEIRETTVKDNSWFAGQTLIDLDLPEEGVLILAIAKPGGDFIGAPRGTYRLEAGDDVIVYGRSETLDELAERRRDAAGEMKRARSVAEQEKLEAEQDEKLAEGEAAEPEASQSTPV